MKMTIITIPKESTKKAALVAIPREKYEKFLAWEKIKSFKYFKPTKRLLDVLKKSEEDYKKGKFTVFNAK